MPDPFASTHEPLLPFDTFVMQVVAGAPRDGVEVLRTDQVHRWRNGVPIAVERYLESFPHILAAAEDALLMIAGEIDLRRQLGENPSLDDYQRRFPAFAIDIAIQFMLQNQLAVSPVETLPLSSGLESIPSLDGYTILDELGTGGMGVVYRASDALFGRDVAVKFMRRKHANEGAFSEAKRRFRDEARITARLQHPGVPPVYDAGTLPDGRPYLIMKLIRGRTLDELLIERPNLEADRPHLLTIFEQVCQTVAYAHSRGVIHRDLKPSNIMVGAFAEVQVMDWGLAKVLGDVSDSTDDGPVPTARDQDEDSLTATGTRIGTPAFMAPEQAAGYTSMIGRPADVYGLGGILCVILTGKPPHAREDDAPSFSLPSVESILNRCFPRLESSGAESELIALAKKCLVPDLRERYRDAREVADAIAAYRTGLEARARHAELERARLEVQAREERKRRKVQRALTIAVCSFIGLAGIAAWWRQGVLIEQAREQTRRIAEARRIATVELQRAEDQRQRLMLTDALRTLDSAKTVLDATNESDLQQRIEEQREQVQFLLELDRIRIDKAGFGVGRSRIEAAHSQYAAIFRQHGFDLDAEPVAKLGARMRESPLRYDLAAALDDWARDEMNRDQQRKVSAIAAAALGVPERERMWDQPHDRAGWEKIIAQLGAEGTPGLMIRLAWELRHQGGDGRRVLEDGLARSPTDFWLFIELGNMGLTPPGRRFDLAANAYRAAIAIRPNSAAGYRLLGNALYSQGKAEQAIKAFQTALAIDPDDADAHLGLGEVKNAAWQLDAAIGHFERSMSIEPKFASAYVGLGESLRRKGQRQRAMEAFRRAIELEPEHQYAHLGMATIHNDAGEYGQALAYLRIPAKIDPENADYLRSLGFALAGTGQHAEAITAFDRLLTQRPDTWAHFGRGNALLELKRFDDAIRAFEAALALDPNNDAAWNGIGDTQFKRKNTAAAIQAFERAIAIDPNYPAHHFGLGVSLRQQGNFLAAIRELRIAVIPPNRERSRDPVYYDELASLLHQAGWYEEAAKVYADALRLGKDQRGITRRLGIVLRQLGQWSASIDRLQEAGDNVERQRSERMRTIADQLRAKQMPQSPAEQAEFAEVAAIQGDFAYAWKAYTTAFAADPTLETKYREDAARVALRLAPEDQRESVHQQARKWLQAELAAIQGKPMARIPLARWLANPDFATIRESPPIEADEWKAFWSSVRRTLSSIR